MRRMWFCALMLVVSTAAPSALAADPPRTESAAYVAGYVRLCNVQYFPDPIVGSLFDPVHDALPGYQGPGAGCFALRGDEASVEILLEDANAAPVPGGYYFTFADHSFATGTFCGSVAGVPVPAGAARLEVYAYPADLLGACGDAVSDGATIGTVTATFYS